MLVTFYQVSVKYLDQTILDQASFTIHENDKIGIVGGNGAGKSTLLKAIYLDILLMMEKFIKRII